MAKIKPKNFIDTFDTVLSSAKGHAILHIYTEGKFLNGKTIKISGREILLFGTTRYLVLEQGNRLKEATINTTRIYGTQFPLSQSYLLHPINSNPKLNKRHNLNLQ